MILRRPLLNPLRSLRLHRSISNVPPPVPSVDVDEVGMPLEPTWSIKELLASYPPPTLEPATVNRLHKLAALIPPKEGTPEFEALRNDLAEMIRMVEAVKTVELSNGQIPDGRIWPEGRGMTFEDPAKNELNLPSDPHGEALLQHASKNSDGFYLVETEKIR